jgi:SRSO17 transposase
MDAGYGTDTALRGSITALGLSYVAGIQPQTSVWAPGTGPRPPKKWSGNGRPPKLPRRDSKHRPISAKKLAIGLPSHAWHKITWREGTAERLSSRFARVRVRPAHRDYWLAGSRPSEKRIPLRNSLHQAVQGSCNSQNLSTAGIRHCGLNGTFQIRSRLFGEH